MQNGQMQQTPKGGSHGTVFSGNGAAVERHAMSKKGSETKKAEKSRENIKKAQFYVEFHAKPGDKLQKGA